MGKGTDRAGDLGGQWQISQRIIPWELCFFTSESGPLFPRMRWTKGGLIGLFLKANNRQVIFLKYHLCKKAVLNVLSPKASRNPELFLLCLGQELPESWEVS